MTITGGLPTPCTGDSSDATYEYISNVSAGTINNTTGASNYTDYTTLSTTVNTNNNFNVTVSIGNAYTSDVIRIWCDWNQNGVFTDAGEAVYTSSAGVGPFTASIAVPSNATIGVTRMRIRLSDSQSGDVAAPCGTSTYGEVEDYKLAVQQGIGVSELNPSAAGINSEEMIIYPNPSSDGTVRIQGAHAGQFYLINAAGQLVQTIYLTSDNQYSYDLTNLADGMYVLSGQNRYGIVKKKIIIRR